MTVEEAKACKENKTPVNITYGTLTFYGGVIEGITYNTNKYTKKVSVVLQVVDNVGGCTHWSLPEQVSKA